MKQLEEAASFLTMPPQYILPAEKRKSAETVFLKFRRTKSPYQLCRQILETSNTDYILFETAGLLKRAVVEEWRTLPEADISSLRQYLLDYVIRKPNLAPYVRGQILQIIAIIIKRSGVNDFGEERNRILCQAEDFIMNGDLSRQVLGCNIISLIMQEYMPNQNSSNIGVTWEVHVEEKKRFEANDLKRIFKFCVGVLKELINRETQEDAILIKHLLPIAEDVLIWRFVPNRLSLKIVMSTIMSTFNEYNISNQPLRLTRNWQDVILDPAVLDIFFTLYWKVRNNPQLAHHAMNCLIQLATVNGKIMETEAEKLQYLSNYMERFLNFLTNVDIVDHEASGIANIAKNIFLSLDTLFVYLPKHMSKSFFEQMSRLTCVFIERAAQEESLCVDDCLYMEAVKQMFAAWLLPGANGLQKKLDKERSTQIFDVYLQCHLSMPEGLRNAGQKDAKEEEIDFFEDDKIRFLDQLQTIGKFGREILSHSLPLLAQLIEDRTSKLRECLNKLVGQADSINLPLNNSMTGLYDDLHWLLLIAGHVLCMESEGEVALIPSEIILYSMRQVREGEIDVNNTLQYLASSENVLSDINVATESIDHVIRLIADIFRLCAIEKTAISIRMGNILSPELSCTIMWFLHRWSLCYLLPRESDYVKISTTLLLAFGEDSLGAEWTVNFLLEKVECNLNAFQGETEVIEETIKVLTTLVKTQTKATCVLKSKRFEHILDLATKFRYDVPQVVKRGLMLAIVQVGAAVKNSSVEEGYWSRTLQLYQNRFKEITSNVNFRHSYHEEQVKVQIIDILESLIGVAQGARGPVAKPVFRYTCPLLDELPKLVSLYYNYQQIVQLILELLFECSKGLFCSLSEDDRIRVYEICLNTIRNYTRWCINRWTIDQTAEENSIQNTLLLMQLLTNLLSQDILNHNSVESTPYDVFLSGFEHIMCLLNKDLLKVPTLCSQYFEMIMRVCKIYPGRMCSLFAELLQPVLESVELGLHSFGCNIATLCCDIITVLAKHIYTETPEGHPPNRLLSRFLNVLYGLALTPPIDMDFTSKASTPIYYLICCYQADYQQLVQNILSEQPDREVATRLADAFTKLTENVELNGAASNKNRFKDNFNEYVVNVHGFSIVK